MILVIALRSHEAGVHLLRCYFRDRERVVALDSDGVFVVLVPLLVVLFGRAGVVDGGGGPRGRAVGVDPLGREGKS